jgi:predicted ATPase
MGHLPNFELENFKIFANRFKFEFAPLTILTGTNSSGKSCLMKAMSLLENSLTKFPNFEGLAFDYSKSLGAFEDSLNSDNKAMNPYIKFCMPLDIRPFNKKFYIDLWFEKNDAGSQKNGRLVNLEIFCEETSSHTSVFHFSILPPAKGPDSLTEEVILSPNIRNYKRSINFSFVTELLKELDVVTNESRLLLEAKKVIKNKEADYERIDTFKSNFYENEELRQLNLSKDSPNLEDDINEEYLSVFLNGDKAPLYEYFPLLEGMNPFDSLKFAGRIPLSKEQIDKIVEFEKEALKTMGLGIEFEIDLSSSNYSSFSNNGILKPRSLEKMIEELISDTKRMVNKAIFQDSNPFILSDQLTTRGSLLINQGIIWPIIGGLKRLKNTLNINYLGALRASQQRFITNTSNSSSLNNIIEEFTELNVSSNDLIKRFLNFWFNQFDLGEEIIVEISDSGYMKIPLVKRNGVLVNLADLGFGTSQLIPVILNIGIAAFKNLYGFVDNHIPEFAPSIICIEEPESNLHPALQSKLSDLFIDAAYKFNIQFIIETHSEYIVRKLQYCTAKKIIAPEATRIFYFNNPKAHKSSQNRIKVIEINKDGSLTDDFGPGFFDEAANWKFELLDLKNRGN